MKRLFFSILAIAFFISLFAVPSSNVRFGKSEPNWKYQGVTFEPGLPGVKHYVWELVRPPYGPFDKIALHRFVYEPKNFAGIPGLPAKDKKKVLFVIPGTWNNGSPKGCSLNRRLEYIKSFDRIHLPEDSLNQLFL